jgi:Na+/glutamate symporter
MSRLYWINSFAAFSMIAAGTIDSELSSSVISGDNLSDEITPAPTPMTVSAEIVHEDDALAALCMNVIIILCLLAAYYVKHFRYHHIPESTISLMVGVVVGGIVRLTTDNMQLWEFVSDRL